MKIIIQALAFMVSVLLVADTCWSQGSKLVQAIGPVERTALYPTRATIEFGRTVVEANCAGCHGMNGISDVEGKPHLAGQRAVYLYRALKAFQSGDRADEPKNHNDFLNDKALLSAAIYYSSLTPANPVEVTVAVEGPDTGEQLLEEDPFLGIREPMRKCIKCHGETGNSSRSGMANLTAQDPAYFVTSMLAYINGSRSHKLMKKLVGNLDEKTIKDMGVYYAVQDPLQTEHKGEGDVNVGRRLSADCEDCHGGDGNAKKAEMPSLAGQDAKYFVKAMNHYKDGKRQHQKMFEAVEKLSEQDMIDLATYYANQQPRRRDIVAPLKSTEWIARCERCHGIDGNSNDPRFPMLAGQDETYLKKALKAYSSGTRESTTMHAMADPLSPMAIERISAYFSSQQPRAVVYLRLPCEDEQEN